jgi:hypothetical protein
LTDGRKGLELVRILEASTRSLEKGGAPVELAAVQTMHRALETTGVPSRRPEFQVLAPKLDDKKRPTQDGRKLQIKLHVDGK